MNSNSILSYDDDSAICEALGCYSKATGKITLKVGSKGTITLFLCESCKPRFSANDSSQQNSRGLDLNAAKQS
ncbi:MAG: hypothetical protein WCF03_01870 [Nitrososphaeraceae archaeon]